jgi:hypothetical protein
MCIYINMNECMDTYAFMYTYVCINTNKHTYTYQQSVDISGL